ncbi:MAG: hypothetical protein AAF404_03870 [Pseudomonadota bacterium]
MKPEISKLFTCLIPVLLSACQGSSDGGDTNVGTHHVAQPNQSNYCSGFIDQADAYFCEDFTGTSPASLVGIIPPMSFRDQTYRSYRKGELFTLADPTQSTHQDNVLNAHTDLIDGMDFSQYANTLKNVAAQWDITAHSRDGYIAPGTGSGFNDSYYWNEQMLMADHGNRCGRPINLSQRVDSSRNNQRGFTFMEEFFSIPASYNGDENALSDYWSAEYEQAISDDIGLHPVLRYEDMIYVCADHLMTAAYATGASKLSLTPNHLLDTSAGKGVVEFSVSTYRTAGRDYWQIDLTPPATHLQLPEGDVVADANGKAVNGFNINTALDEGANGIADILGRINVFRTLMTKDNRFLANGRYIDPHDPQAQYMQAQIANPGNPERLDVYASAPEGEDWVLTHTSYNQVMLDYLKDTDPTLTLHNVTDNRTRARFRLTVLEAPDNTAWDAQLWDQVSLCMPDYNNGCVGEYIVPELPDELLVQFTHYAYNTTKSCTDNVGQPHDKPGAAFQSLCHPNTYHWDNFYISPAKAFQIIKSDQRTYSADGNAPESIAMLFDEPAPANTKLRFTALSGDENNATTLQVSFDRGNTWQTPSMQFEPQNDFGKFRSYYTGTDTSPYIPAGTQEVWVRATNPDFRTAYWVRDTSFWVF